MDRSPPRRTSHTSTSDLLTWSQFSPPESDAARHRSRQHRYSHSQPSVEVGEVLPAGQLTNEAHQNLTKKKECCGHKMKEMLGSDIFLRNAYNTAASEASSENSDNRTSMYQQALNGIGQISFSTEESTSPKKPTSLPEEARQRELSQTLQNEPDTLSVRQMSSAKTKELRGNDIFGPFVPTLSAPHTLESKENKNAGEPVSRNLRTSVQVSNPAAGQSNFFFGEETVKKSTSKKIDDQNFAELTGNSISNSEGDIFPGSVEKHLRVSSAKRREMTGSDLFADGKAENREHIRGAGRPPGGGSTISLV